MNRTNLFLVGLAFLAVVLILLVGGREDKLSNSDSVIATSVVEELDSRETGEPIQKIVTTDKTESALGNPDVNLDSTNVSSGTLLSNSWVWKETLMNDGAVISPKQTGVFVLTFDAEGRVSGQTDCNGFGGGYTLTDGVLSMGEFMMTMMYCEGSQEMEFQEMLSEPVTYMFTEVGELVLMLPFDSGSVIFEPKR